MQKMKWLHFKDNSLPFFPHHINRRKNYYYDNGKAEIVMLDLNILIFLLQHIKTAHVQVKSFAKFCVRA